MAPNPSSALAPAGDCLSVGDVRPAVILLRCNGIVAAGPFSTRFSVGRPGRRFPTASSAVLCWFGGREYAARGCHQQASVWLIPCCTSHAENARACVVLSRTSRLCSRKSMWVTIHFALSAGGFRDVADLLIAVQRPLKLLNLSTWVMIGQFLIPSQHDSLIDAPLVHGGYVVWLWRRLLELPARCDEG